MQTKIEQLRSKLKEAQSRISKDAFSQWTSSATTKALLIRLEIDLEDLKECWADGLFDDKKLVAAQGQAAYLSDLPYIIKALGAFEDED